METQPFNHTGFNAYLDEGRLMAARCQNCGQVFLPPRGLCPDCYRTDMEWVELSGEGHLTGFTTIYVGLPELASQGFTRENPYCSGVVRLAEGPVICGQILGADCELPQSLRMGMPLQAVFVERMSGENRRVYLVFEPKVEPSEESRFTEES